MTGYLCCAQISNTLSGHEGAFKLGFEVVKDNATFFHPVVGTQSKHLAIKEADRWTSINLTHSRIQRSCRQQLKYGYLMILR